MRARPDRVIIDTNLWISYLITKDYQWLDRLIINRAIVLVFNHELFDEFIEVAQRSKFSRFFNGSDLERLIKIFDQYAVYIDVKSDVKICRDLKDNFLLSLAKDSKAKYLLTGDNDLLDLKMLGKTKILTINEFRNIE
jgi:putative PIN family toxin of toxin-antitoxin system